MMADANTDRRDPVQHIAVGQTPVISARTRNGLNHVQSLRAQIESTSPATTPLYPSRTGPEIFFSPIKPSQHKRGTSQQWNQPDALPLGSDDIGKTFVPSGTSFEPLRIHRQARPSGPRVPHTMCPNLDQLDIQDLRRALKPVTTGNKVKSVVDRWETHKVGLHNPLHVSRLIEV